MKDERQEAKRERASPLPLCALAFIHFLEKK